MTTGGASYLEILIVVLGLSYYLAKPRFFERVAYLISLPIYHTTRFLLYVFWLFSLGAVKLLLLVIIGVSASFIYLVSAPVSFFGRLSLSRYISYIIYKVVDEDRIAGLRYNLVQAMMHHREGRPELESESEYKEELKDIQQGAIENIERGETFISVMFGLMIFSVSTWELPVPEYNLVYFTISFVEVYLFVLSIAALYRISFLEILAFSGDEGFDTLDEWDVAVTIQRGICQLKIVKLGLLLLSTRFVISDHQYRAGFRVFRELNSGELWGAPRNVLARAWEIQREERNRSD